MEQIVRYIVIYIIKFYKLAISPFLPRVCRFYPSCSTYAIEAIEKYGVIKGVGKSVYRLLRCHPCCKGGVDVP